MRLGIVLLLIGGLLRFSFLPETYGDINVHRAADVFLVVGTVAILCSMAIAALSGGWRGRRRSYDALDVDDPRRWRV